MGLGVYNINMQVKNCLFTSGQYAYIIISKIGAFAQRLYGTAEK